MIRILTSILLVASTCSLMYAQVWEGKSADFPTNLFGAGIYAINDHVAWCWGVEIDSNGLETYAHNAISVTGDHGFTWNRGIFPIDSAYVTSICALDDQRAWMTFDRVVNGLNQQNYVVKTMDGGQSWTPENVTVNVFVDFIYMWDETEGIVVGDPDINVFEMYKTSNSGNTWDRILISPPSFPGEAIFADNYAVKGDQLWFGTTKGRIYHTPDRGMSWEVLTSPFGGFTSASMSVSDAGDIYEVFYRYVAQPESAYCFLYRRNAADGLWTNITEATNNYFMYDLKAIPGSNVLMSTINAWLTDGLQTRISYDRGVSWIVIDESPVTYFDFYSPETGYASQFHLNDDPSPTLVYRYAGSPLTGLIKHTPLLDAELYVFPNPAVDVVHLDVKMKGTDDYWLLLNDVSGKLIFKKEISDVSEMHETIDMVNIPAGTYILTIANSKGVKTEKVVKK